MPRAELYHVSEVDVQQALSTARRPGYEWVEGRFGPPPGIPKAEKERLDALSDEEYLRAVMTMDLEVRESLMASEAERRRTFRHWPLGSVNWEDCAKTGLYYTGSADRSQCAFCAGVFKNWRSGDIPRVSHKNAFPYCKLVQGKATYNIPYSEDNQLLAELVANTRISATGESTAAGLNIDTTTPKTPRYSMYGNRMRSFQGFPQDCPITAERLCEAGFYWLRQGDGVKCFWCDGSLEDWAEGDDPWSEHARWYPGCSFLRQSKGADFISDIRNRMTAADVEAASSLVYNSTDLSFLNSPSEKPLSEVIKTYPGYQYCMDLGYPSGWIDWAYKQFEYADVKISTIIDKLHQVEDNEEVLCEGAEEIQAIGSPTAAVGVNANTVESPAEQEKEESKRFLKSVTCQNCHKNISGAVALPCGCFCLCKECSETNRLPKFCPNCQTPVKGSCKVYLG